MDRRNAVIRNCPICKNDIIKNLFSLKGFKVGKCMNCKHVYVMNPDNNIGTKLKKSIDINKIPKRHYQIVKLIDRLYRNKKTVKIAEIGAGYGHLANLFSKKSNKYDYTGYEPNPGRANFCCQNNVNVKNDFFKIKPSNYDVVILDNVLEHVVNPFEIISAAAKSLAEGGCLIIIVPNRYDVRRLHPKWRDRHFWQPRSHVSYYSYGDLARLTKYHDLVIKVFGLNSFVCSFGLLIKIILDLVGVRISGLYVYALKRN